MAPTAKKAATAAKATARKTVTATDHNNVTRNRKKFPVGLLVAGLIALGAFYLFKQNGASLTPGGLSKVSGDADPENIEQWSYANGYAIGQDIATSVDGLDEAMKVDKAVVAQAISDVLTEKDLKLTEDQVKGIYEKRNEMAIAIQQEKAKEGADYLEEFKTQSGVKTETIGTAYKVLTSGDGETVGKENVALVQYVGKKVDQTEFDSSEKNGGEPVPFPSSAVIPGLRPVLEKMKVGDKYEIVVPADQAYGAQGVPGVIGPNETLIFEMEVTGVRSIAELQAQQQAAQAAQQQAQQPAAQAETLEEVGADTELDTDAEDVQEDEELTSADDEAGDN